MCTSRKILISSNILIRHRYWPCEVVIYPLVSDPHQELYSWTGLGCRLLSQTSPNPHSGTHNPHTHPLQVLLSCQRIYIQHHIITSLHRKILILCRSYHRLRLFTINITASQHPYILIHHSTAKKLVPHPCHFLSLAYISYNVGIIIPNNAWRGCSSYTCSICPYYRYTSFYLAYQEPQLRRLKSRILDYHLKPHELHQRAHLAHG